MPRGFFPERMHNFTPWFNTVPAPLVTEHDQEPARCIRISEALIPYLLGMLELARYEHKFDGTPEDKQRAVMVFQKLAAALALDDVCIEFEDCEMYALRQKPNEPCKLEQSTDGGATWSLAFDFALCLQAQSEPPIRRYDPVYGRIENSFDGGATWSPGDDPRYDSPLAPNPFPLSLDPPCWTSSNVIQFIKQFLELDDEQNAIAIISGLLALIIGALVPLQIINFLVAAMIQAGIEALQNAFTDEEWAIFLKNLYCHASPDGSWTLEAFFAIYDQVLEDHSGIAQIFLRNTLSTIGWSGLNNAGFLDEFIGSADCSAIDCGDCGAVFEVANFGQNPAYGVFLGVFDGAYRFQSQPNGAGFDLITLMTSGPDVCCSLEVVTGTGAPVDAYFHIACGDEQIQGNLQGTWPLLTPLNYLSCQGNSGQFTIDITFT